MCELSQIEGGHTLVGRANLALYLRCQMGWGGGKSFLYMISTNNACAQQLFPMVVLNIQNCEFRRYVEYIGPYLLQTD